MSSDRWQVAGRYVNLDGSAIPPSGSLRRVLRWKLGRTRDARVFDGALDAPAAPVTPDGARLADPPPVQVTWLGHATALIQLDGRAVLTDPLFGAAGFGFVRRLAPPPLAPEALPRIDAVVVSHNHYDHCDLPSLRAVRRLHPAAVVVVPAGLGGWMRQKLGDPVVELGWWAHTALDGIELHAVPAHHWSTRGPGDIRRSHWCGFVARGGSASVYFAGDTGAGPHFAAIAARMVIDVALLPIGAYAPRWFMRDQHMNPEDAVAAAQTLGAHLLPIHWGTYRLTDEPLDEPPRWAMALAAEAGVPMTVLAPGGRWTPAEHAGAWVWPG
ncbi:MAG: MBL fold metallo-hydrolase [Myxococcales bacterium]|nr:MBL fold metallo-hydrolase [Myxococcales bacterium]